MWLFSFIFFCLISVNCREIYVEIPDINVSHCSRKLNVDSHVGCSSKFPSSMGEILISNNASNLRQALSTNTSSLIVVIPLELFADRQLVKFLRDSENVVGLFVFSPGFPDTTSLIHDGFSENTPCPNGNFTFYNSSVRLCDVNPKWNPSSFEYATISWPFPVVLADGNDNVTWDKISTCYNTYNKVPIDDTRCFMEIRNFMSAVQSSQICYSREILMSYHAEQSSSFCSQLSGVNLMMRARNATNSTSARQDPSILVFSRVDSLSMFDRKATSAFAVLPAVSVLVSAAVHLLNQPAIKAGKMRKNLLFLLLDNEAFGFMGSQRFLFDLTHSRVAQASGLPLNVEGIESVIELSGLGLPQEDEEKRAIYYLLSDSSAAKQSENITKHIWAILNASADGEGGGINLLNGSSVLSALLPPSVSTQALLKYFVQRGQPLSHTIISDRPASPPLADIFIDSFLDNQWPPNLTVEKHLLQLANLLADALHRIVTEDSLPIPEPIGGVKPAELMNCFLKNPGCDLLRMHLEPEVVDFLLSLKGPIPMQAYEPIEGRSWRVSHVVSRLLIGLTGERLKECPPTEDYGSFTYMYGYYNGSMWCYRSLVETATSFFFLEDGVVASPGWVRSMLFQNQRFVRLFRSSSPSNDQIALFLGIVLTAVTGFFALLIRGFADRLFVISYDHPYPQPF